MFKDWRKKKKGINRRCIIIYKAAITPEKVFSINHSTDFRSQSRQNNKLSVLSGKNFAQVRYFCILIRLRGIFCSIMIKFS